jgi:hypothetical protein
MTLSNLAWWRGLLPVYLISHYGTPHTHSEDREEVD